MILIFAIIYRLTPTRNLTFKEVLPGASFATVCWVLSSMGFAFYVDNFNNYSRTYGSIGAVIVLMIWLFLSSVILLVGGEINALLEGH
jgi:membrane protein